MKRKYVVYVLVVLAAFAIYACSGGEDAVILNESGVGEATLAGIDSDGDGVRDGVGEYIVENYEDEATQQALTQYARAEQDFVLSGGNETLAVEATLASDRARDCLRSMHSTEEVRDITDKMLDASLNTEERMRAYLIADSLLGGHTFWSTPPEERAAMCE